MNASKIYRDIIEKRSTLSWESFGSTIREDGSLDELVEVIYQYGQRWGLKVGLLGEKPVAKKEVLSPKEEEWKNFFASHSFSGTESARTFADALSIVTGMDLNRFIINPSENKSKSNFFPPWISIVPTANTNGHHYQKGKPILSFGSSPVFIKMDSETGDNMDTSIECLRLSTREEILDLLISIFYRSSNLVERIVLGVA